MVPCSRKRAAAAAAEKRAKMFAEKSSQAKEKQSGAKGAFGLGDSCNCGLSINR
jgi:hypothetical protein